MTLEDDSYTGSVVMKWKTSNSCSVQDSWITFYNTHDKTGYETFVNRKL